MIAIGALVAATVLLMINVAGVVGWIHPLKEMALPGAPQAPRA